MGKFDTAPGVQTSCYAIVAICRI